MQLSSKRVIEDIEPPSKGRKYHRDSKIRGLQLCVTAAGNKTWYFRRRVNGRPERLYIGPFPDVTPHQAAQRATEMAGQIAAGNDPRVARQATRHVPTLNELWAAYFEQHAKIRTKRWAESEKIYSRHLKSLGAMPLSHITEPMVSALHAKIGATAPIAANRVITLLSALFNKARRLVDWRGDNPCSGVEKFPETSRERFLDADELRLLLDALEKYPYPVFAAAIKIMLLTGARKSNVLAMRWEDVDLSRGVWTIPADKSKSGKEMSIPLVPAAHALLMERRQASEAYAARKTRKHPKPTEVSPWVFPGRHDVGHLSSVKGHWKSLLKTAGLHNVWMHDLRRTLGSWLAAAGGSEYIIGKALGHSDPSATKVYARLHLDPVRQHMTAVTEAMLALPEKKIS